MSDKIEIKTIELTVAGQKIKLTLAQAKELKTVLEELFPVQYVTLPTPVVIHRDVWPTHPWKQWDVWCQSGNSTLCLSANTP